MDLISDQGYQQIIGFLSHPSELIQQPALRIIGNIVSTDRGIMKLLEMGIILIKLKTVFF